MTLNLQSVSNMNCCLALRTLLSMSELSLEAVPTIVVATIKKKNISSMSKLSKANITFNSHIVRVSLHIPFCLNTVKKSMKSSFISILLLVN